MASVNISSVDSIGLVVIDNPSARNALTLQMYRDIRTYVERAEEHSLKAILFAGNEQAFASGTAISEFTSFDSAEDGVRYEKNFEAVLLAVSNCAVPTLAALSGACTGGGAAIAAACDLRIATPSLRFGFPIARTLGNCLSINNLRRLVALVGLGRAQEMMLRATLLDAEDALTCGLVSELVDSSELLSRGVNILREVAQLSPLSISASREGFRHLDEAFYAEISETLIRRCYGSKDFKEGVAAFIEKRAPIWQGI